LARIDPVVRRAGVFLLLAADEGAVLHARDVARVRAREIAVRPQPLVQPDEGPGSDQLAAQPVVLGLGAVAPDDLVGLGQPCHFRDPLAQGAMAYPGGCERLVDGRAAGSIHSRLTPERQTAQRRLGRSHREYCAAGILAPANARAATGRSAYIDRKYYKNKYLTPESMAYLPMQNRAKISPSRSSALNSPVIVPSEEGARRNSSPNSSQRPLARAAAARCSRACCSARRWRSRARNTGSPLEDQPAASRIA